MRPQLNRRLTLEARVRAADGAGGYAGGWAPSGVHWAEVRAGHGRLASGEGYARAETGLRITLRAVAQGAPSRPEAGQRFRDGTRVYKIRSVTEADPGGRYLVCFAEEELAS